jgi:hypothetical protein
MECIIHTEHNNLCFSATVMISSRRKENGEVRKAYKLYVGNLEVKILELEFVLFSILSNYFPFVFFKISIVRRQVI